MSTAETRIILVNKGLTECFLFRYLGMETILSVFIIIKTMEKSLVKLICISCLSLAGYNTNAQQVLQDTNGRPIFAKQYIDVQGSPYFSDIWLQGSVRLSDGKFYENMALRYDLVGDQLIFKSLAGEPMNFVLEVNEFKLLSTAAEELNFRNGFKPADEGTEKTFYQVLSDGETPLLKRTWKKVIEQKPYTSATIEKSFRQLESYYLVKQGTPVRIKKDRKAVLEILTDYHSQLDQFIKLNNLNLKNDPDLVSLITYYNSLK
jgi:hypothetical protein